MRGHLWGCGMGKSFLGDLWDITKFLIQTWVMYAWVAVYETRPLNAILYSVWCSSLYKTSARHVQKSMILLNPFFFPLVEINEESDSLLSSSWEENQIWIIQWQVGFYTSECLGPKLFRISEFRISSWHQRVCSWHLCICCPPGLLHFASTLNIMPRRSLFRSPRHLPPPHPFAAFCFCQRTVACLIITHLTNHPWVFLVCNSPGILYHPSHVPKELHSCPSS